MKSWVIHSLDEASRRLDPARDGELLADLSKITELAEHYLEPVFWHPATDTLIGDLAHADTLDDVSDQVREVRNALDLQHVTICAVREGAGSIFPHRVLTTCPPEWSREYTENRYHLSDPVFLEPVPEKPELLHELAALSPITEDYLRRARRAGIGPSGLVCWSEVAKDTVVAVVLTSSAPPTEFMRRMERLEWDLAAVAEALARAFARANGVTRTDHATLTDDDLTILRAVATGQSGRAALRRGADLCRRLGARTLAQAAAAVSATGLLSYAPVRMDEIWFSGRPPSANATSLHEPGLHLTGPNSRPAAPKEKRRQAPGEWSVRPWQDGWAVFRNDVRVSNAIACDKAAERACTQAAWGPGRRPLAAVDSPAGNEIGVASARCAVAS